MEKVSDEGYSSGPTPGTLKTGFWQAARVEFVKITLSKLLTHCPGCLPELVSQLSWWPKCLPSECILLVALGVNSAPEQRPVHLQVAWLKADPSLESLA